MVLWGCWLLLRWGEVVDDAGLKIASTWKLEDTGKGLLLWTRNSVVKEISIFWTVRNAVLIEIGLYRSFHFPRIRLTLVDYERRPPLPPTLLGQSDTFWSPQLQIGRDHFGKLTSMPQPLKWKDRPFVGKALRSCSSLSLFFSISPWHKSSCWETQHRMTRS